MASRRPPLRDVLSASGGNVQLGGYRLEEVPEALRARRGIVHLVLSNNALRTLPTWMGTLDGLHTLYVSGNPLEVIDGPVLACLAPGARLDLSGTDLRALPDALAHVPVASLTLNAMRALDWPQALDVIARSATITSLALNHDPALAPYLARLGACRSVRSLYLTFCELTALPDALGDLSALESISVTDNPLDGIPDAVARIPTLRSIFLPRGRALTAERKRLRALRPDIRLLP